MESAGKSHTVLLRSDGTAVACGSNDLAQCNIPALEPGVFYIQTSAGGAHTGLLRSDGTAVACGSNYAGQCNIPALEPGVFYTQLSAGEAHTVLLRSDGTAVACGSNYVGQCNIPALEPGLFYTQLSAGNGHTVLLRSDGTAVACGGNSGGQCSIPPLDVELSYRQVSAAGSFTVLLRSDGKAVACGINEFGRCNIPPLEAELSYTQVSAGFLHTVLLRSDGKVVACGSNLAGQCNIPAKDAGHSYTHVSAGFKHSAFLRSDGTAAICGEGEQCNSQLQLEPSSRYVNDLWSDAQLILQVNFSCKDDEVSVLCSTMSGAEKLLKAQAFDSAWDVHKRIALELHVALQSLQVVLPDGELLAKVCQANPAATIADTMKMTKRFKLAFWDFVFFHVHCRNDVKKRPSNTSPLTRHLQEKCIKAVLRECKLTPTEVDCIECHGTGTSGTKVKGMGFNPKSGRVETTQKHTKTKWAMSQSSEVSYISATCGWFMLWLWGCSSLWFQFAREPLRIFDISTIWLRLGWLLRANAGPHIQMFFMISHGFPKLYVIFSYQGNIWFPNSKCLFNWLPVKQ